VTFSKAAPATFVVLWATGFIGARYAMPWCEPFLFLAARFAIAGVIIALIAAIGGIKWPFRNVALHAAISGSLIHGVYLGAVFWAIRNGLPAGMSALIVGIQPLLTAMIAGAALNEKITPRHWAGLITGLAGIALVLSPKLSFTGQGVNVATLGASVLAVFAVSAGTIWQKRFVTGADLRGTTAFQYLGAFLVAAVMSLLFENGKYTLTGELLFAMIWLVGVLSIGAIFLLMRLIRDGAVSKVASLFYLVPAVTALMAWALFDETLDALQISGMLVTALGVAMATVQPRTFSRAAR
jgi:drug/metabolite transporter (DMT)-like permease